MSVIINNPWTKSEFAAGALDSISIDQCDVSFPTTQANLQGAGLQVKAV